MNTDPLEHLKYPTGRFVLPGEMTQEQRLGFMNELQAFPKEFAATVRSLSKEQLDQPYRPGGWTARQVAHHVPDSHMQAYTRLKMALTEDKPTIKPYDENAWSVLADVSQTPVDVSLTLLESIHYRMNLILRNMKESDWSRSYFHPQSGKEFTLNDLLALYAWHGRHHHGHIKLVVSAQVVTA